MMRRYQAYRDSGVEWLGEVPEGWPIERLGSLFHQADDRGHSDLPILSVSIHSGVSDDELDPDEADRKVSRSEDRSKYKAVCPGDLVYNMMRAWQGGFGTVTVSGLVSPAYVVARPNGRRPFLTSYVEHILRTPMAVEEMRRHSHGVTDFRLRLYWDEFKTISIPLPPLPEQKAIATFLDRETAKIDTLVAEQRRLIELLKEKRQAVISHAVTKGLDPAAPMKDSGIDWLGEVPEGWEVVPLKYLVAFQSGGTPSKDNLDYWDGEVPWASARDLKTEWLSDTGLHITEVALSNGAADLKPAGSVIVLVRGMTLAKAFPVCLTTRALAINQDLKAIQCGDRVHNEFLAWALRGLEAETLARIDEAGHGTKALRMEAWISMEIPVPSLAEQEEIAAHLKAATAKIDELCVGAESAIALLQERRAALISAAVTGKIDVRGVVNAGKDAA